MIRVKRGSKERGLVAYLDGLLGKSTKEKGDATLQSNFDALGHLGLDERKEEPVEVGFVRSSLAKLSGGAATSFRIVK